MTSDYKVRPGDTPRSWTVLFLREGPTLTQSNWAPGYTSAHKATKREALEEAISRVEKDVLVSEERLDVLENMLSTGILEEMWKEDKDGSA